MATHAALFCGVVLPRYLDRQGHTGQFSVRTVWEPIGKAPSPEAERCKPNYLTPATEDNGTDVGLQQTTRPRQHRKVLSGVAGDTTAAPPFLSLLSRTTLANLYHLPELPPPGPACLSGDVAHHLARVLRVRVGETLQVGDGRGRTATATVTVVQKQLVGIELGEITEEAPLLPALTLAFAVPRPSRADWLVEHATEIGVQSFQPLWTERSRPQGLRADRWRKVAAAAAGQCARAWLPEVHEPIELTKLLEKPPAGVRLLADTDGETIDLAASAAAAVLLIGPEGGFSPQEREAAARAQFSTVKFGAHILRTETAALVGAAILLRGTN
ncbi:MAG: 16S rRNA (uracil1498-N3)-methyltransferase [Planctomycetota bacterium]